MPQPHASTTIAAASHHHSHSHASAGNHPRPAPNYPPVFPPRSSSSTSVARTPPVGLAPARSESVPSVPSVPYVHSTTPGNNPSLHSSNNFHYNRGRSGTIDNPATSASYNDSKYDDSVIKTKVADLRYFSSASRTRNPSIDRGSPPSRPPPVPSSPAYFAAALPRTSSLHPPHGLGSVKVLASTPSVPALADVTPIIEDEPSLPPDSLTTKSRRSRASSLGAASDGFRNLNRWSVSTTSSITSPQAERDQPPPPPPLQPPPPSPARPTNFSRRMSVDSIALVNQAAASPQSTYQSPRKLTKRRPSVIGLLPVSPRTTSAAGTRSRRHSPPPPAAPPNLPPIVSLPSLDLSTTPLTTSFNRVSPSADTPSSALSTQPGNSELKNHFWDEQADPDSTSAIANRANPPGLLPSAILTRDTTMGDTHGHTRTRSSTKSSIDSGRSRKQPSQKAMLSKALAKANTAVQLDNARNYAGARTSYLEACELLQHVLARTTGEEDQKKLEAIRRTYASRIEELDGMLPTRAQTGKALPARPDSLACNEDDYALNSGDEEELSPTAARKPDPTVLALTSSFSSRPAGRKNFEGTLTVPQEGGQLMPAPLSPRRPLSPAKPASPEPGSYHGGRPGARGHVRDVSHESLSWLDPIDESETSETESVHSRDSYGVRRKHMRVTSGNTEAEFDAALDAAVEAAYDDGFEPVDSYDSQPYDVEDEDEDDHVVADVMRRVEIAKARVRETEREAQSEREAAIRAARENERQRQLYSQANDSTAFNGHFYDGEDSDEEERMLEDLTRDYALNSFSFNQQAKKPSDNERERESDSSSLTQRTWHSSIGSSPPTATTVLSSVTELPTPPSKPPPSTNLPPPPQLLPQPPPPQVPNGPSGVRSRRLSGQNPKQLKIETAKITQAMAGPSGALTSVHAKGGSYIAQQRQAMSATSTKPGPFSMRNPPSPGRASPGPYGVPPMPAYPDDMDDFRAGSPTGPSAGPALRKNQSSSSLKSLKARQASISYTETTSELSPHTPLSQTLTNNSVSRQPAMPTLPTPMAAAFNIKATSGLGGMHLFDSDFHSPLPLSPSAVQYQGSDAPLPLEPCPADVMLRPFWLMRALYQTLCHPRGGYITSRLFVPRDAWKVKGVKLRALEDKSSQCDLLTAALMKLARVDSNDADAVLEEMQTLENILEQVQQTLTRKLGNEVGSQNAAAYRERDDLEAMPAVPRSSSVGGKSGAFSWRRLRNKGSAVNLTNAYGGKSNSGTGERIPEKEVFTGGSGTLPSLPMVPQPSSRPAKREVSSVKFDGPYSGYMQSLARLFDAAQTVDLIARQVDDPGLRHADKTQVGLELCTRHAAEFFGFYICRFVLADLALLLDKFVKRGSEWVLS